MKFFFVLGILILIGSATAVQIPYEDYYEALNEIEMLGQQAEQYKADHEFGRAYAAMEEAREKKIALETSDLGPIRLFIEVENYVDSGCHNSEVTDLLNDAYGLYETNPREAAVKALDAKLAAQRAGCGAQITPPIAPTEPEEDQSLLFTLIVIVAIVLAVVVFLKVKEKLPS